jgi:hypothetical protein
MAYCGGLAMSCRRAVLREDEALTKIPPSAARRKPRGGNNHRGDYVTVRRKAAAKSAGLRFEIQ